MKHIIAILGVTLLFSCNFINQRNAVEYNNTMIEKQKEIADEISNFINLMETPPSKEELVKIKRNIANKIKENTAFLKNMESFQNELEFKENVINVIKEYSYSFENEYSEIIEFSQLDDSVKTPIRYMEIQKIAETADKRVQDAELKFIEAQKKFASKHNFRLE